MHFFTKPVSVLLAALALPLFAAGASAQRLSVQEVPLTAAHVLYDSGNGKVYASIPGTAAAHPNTVAVLNAATGIVESYIAVGSQPDVLALSSDGGYLYVGTDDASGVARIKLSTNTVDQQFFLPTSPQSPQNHYHAGSIVPLPGLPQSVAVTLDYFGSYPPNDGVAIFDNGVQRPNRLGGGGFNAPGTFNFVGLTGAATANKLYGSDGLSNFVQLTADASGVTLGQTSLLPAGTGYNSRIKFDLGSGLIYTTDGRVIDPAALTVTGTFPLGQLPYSNSATDVLPSHAENRVYFLIGAAAFYNSGTATITGFDQTTLQQVSSFSSPPATGAGAPGIYNTLGDLWEISPTRFVFRSSTGIEFASPQTASSITVTYAKPAVAVGKTDQFTATANYADGTAEDVTNRVVWSSDTPAVATIISSPTGPAGLAQGLTQGTANITATLNGVSSTPYALAVTAAHYTVLWNNADGRASIWDYDADHKTFTQKTYGPYTGWTAKTIALSGSDEMTRVLWNNTSGAASLWMLDNAAGTFAHAEYGPYAGWTATGISTTPALYGNSGQNNLLWNNTSGQSSLWNQRFDAFGSFSFTLFGPFAGWSAQAVANSSSTAYTNQVSVLETNTNGQMALVNPASYNPSLGATFGPYPGWTASALSTAADGTVHILWDNADGRLSVWNYTIGSMDFAHKEYGPFANWTATALADGSDGKTVVLWNNTNGSASLWSLNNVTGAYSHAEFGPYAGWTAKAVSGN